MSDEQNNPVAPPSVSREPATKLKIDMPDDCGDTHHLEIPIPEGVDIPVSRETGAGHTDAEYEAACKNIDAATYEHTTEFTEAAPLSGEGGERTGTGNREPWPAYMPATGTGAIAGILNLWIRTFETSPSAEEIRQAAGIIDDLVEHLKSPAVAAQGQKDQTGLAAIKSKFAIGTDEITRQEIAILIGIAERVGGSPARSQTYNPEGAIERTAKIDLEVITEPIDWEAVENGPARSVEAHTLESLIAALCESDDLQAHEGAKLLREAVYALEKSKLHWLAVLIAPPLYLRCMEHQEVTQMNTTASGSECAACAALPGSLPSPATNTCRFPRTDKGICGLPEDHLHHTNKRSAWYHLFNEESGPSLPSEETRATKEKI